MATRRRIRWDRIVFSALLLVCLIFLLGFCSQRCSDQSDVTGSSTADQSSDESTSSGSSASSISSTTSTTPAISATTNNIPIVVTDMPEQGTDAVAITDSTSTSATSSTIEPVVTLPAGYQESAISASEIGKGSLILVNEEHPCQMTKDELMLEQVYYAEDYPDVYDISYPGHTALGKTALTQFNRLMKAYYGATNNREIMFNYGWLEVGKEKSNPESSSAMDIQLHVKRNDGGYEYVSYTKPYNWLFDHMASYGFINRYPNEKGDITGYRSGYTAIRYVGVPHAAYMQDNDLCLEEYLDLLKNQYSFGKGMLQYSTTEQSYNIYYVPASNSGTCKLPLPTTGSWEISGNNMDGFIVTVVVN